MFQETYINKVLEIFKMKNCSLSPASIVKGDRFSLDQCLKNDLEWEQMRDIPYASAIGNLMYAQVCTKPDIPYVVRVLGIYQSNPKEGDALPSGYKALHADVQTN